MNTQSFISKANDVHNNKYDYSKTNYINSKTKIKIICPIHGEFEQSPSKHLSGSGCKQCAYDNVKTKLSMNNDIFIKKSNQIYNNKYDYSKTNYINSKTKIKIICPIHGEFEQLPFSHLNGHGCKKCAIYNKPYAKEYFISKANDIHNNKYDYSKTNYINSKTKIKIICPIHGEFEQLPANHLHGNGCKKCSSNVDYDDLCNRFIRKATLKYNNKYNYSKVEYFGSHKKVIIICPIHGEFEQTPSNHLNFGCKKCGYKLSNKNRKHNDKSIVEKFEKKHGNQYDYNNVKYVDYKTPVEIVCKKHGSFLQYPDNHLKGCGCVKCNRTHISKAHNEIVEFIKTHVNDVLINDLNILNGKELDIYIPSNNIAIEYNGLYYHSYNDLQNEDKYKHYIKSDLCDSKNIRLVQIFENEWEYHKEIVKSILLSKLNLIENKIFARKCKIRELDNNTYYDFVSKNHIQGITNASIKCGLYYNGILYCVLSFKKHKKYEWEISRYCNLLNHTVVGGFSKLLNYFLNNYSPSNIMTYADRRYSNGNVYLNNKFKLIDITSPGYYYTKGLNLFNRTQFQKHKLHKKLKTYDHSLSEAQNMFNNGYRRIWDSGCLKFIYQV